MSKIFNGTVNKISGAKTISVTVIYTKPHPRFHKIMRIKRKYLIHDEKEYYKVGDVVSFKTSRPISKRKNFVVIYDKCTNSA